MMVITENLIDINRREIYAAKVYLKGSVIERIDRIKNVQGKKNYIIPGLIDAHIHIESSMCTPGAFAMEAVSRGTTGVVCDPHEIANVLGMQGIEFMTDDASKVPVKFWFGAPSCVPATENETSGAKIDALDIETLLKKREVKYLAEMMNFPGVINEDPEVLKKLSLAGKYGKPVDGHAPGLRGAGLSKYINAGISTDHECSSMDEALEKISLGMKIIIREGSAARNLDSLRDLFKTHPEKVMLCSDDLHPEMLVKRHINGLVSRLVKEGYDLFDVIRSCTFNPSLHYNLNAGLLREGDKADFIIVDKYDEMNVLETWIEGKKVYDRGNVLFSYEAKEPVNRFNCSRISGEQIKIVAGGLKMLAMEAYDGELLTGQRLVNVVKGHIITPDIKKDILKIAVKDRYNDGPPAIGFINGFGLKKGAFASSVAHDSHNIIAVGTNDTDIVKAINAIIKMKGGLAVSCGDILSSLPLPVAGIMSDRPAGETACSYEKMSDQVRLMGCGLSAPFMTLSFMALLVIPELKISDKGLFDVNRFCRISLFQD